MIQAKRTPDICFENLPGHSFKPHYIDDLNGYENLRLHYIDEGPKDAEHTFLCLHGQPTWSYLYRKMIPVFCNAGHRVIAPDFFGFGRSDKPINDQDYTFKFHRTLLLRLIERLDLNKITLTCQDWGGVIGLTLPMEMPERFERLLVMNTALATGQQALSEDFLKWRQFINSNPDVDIARIMKKACPQLSTEEIAAYAAPFPDQQYKAGVRRFPNLAPERTDDDCAIISQQALEWWNQKWQGQAFMAVGMQDPLLGLPVMLNLRMQIRACPPPLKLTHAGHFVQECGEEVAQEALAAFEIGTSS